MISVRWPKSGLDVIVTVLEGEEDCVEDDREGITNGQNERATGWGLMTILSGCITVASAAIADAGIDCVDLVTGGVAAIVREPMLNSLQQQQKSGFTADDTGASTIIVLDPCPSEHQEILAACVVGYLQSCDEVTEIWAKGNIPKLSSMTKSETSGFESLLDQAVEVASSARLVQIEAIKESTARKVQRS